MLAALVATNSAAPTPGERSGNAYMDCGTAPLCGVLVLETGFGSGNYKHQEPGVHGLWPETESMARPSASGPRSHLVNQVASTLVTSRRALASRSSSPFSPTSGISTVAVLESKTQTTSSASSVRWRRLRCQS